MASSRSRSSRRPTYPRRAWALLVVVILIVAACGSSTSSPGPSGSTAASEAPAPPSTVASGSPAAGTDTSVLTVGVNTIGPGEWAPARTGDDMADVSKHLWSPLIRLNHDTLAFEGLMAESYSLSPDGLTWNFKLRPNIPFHDGNGTVTAEDVKYSWGQWISEESNHANGTALRQAVGDDLETGFEVVSDLEFNLHAKTPVVTLAAVLSDQGNGLQVVPKKYYEEQGAAANDHPIGTGPWKFVSYTPGVEAVYDAVKDHFFQAPAFDRLVIKEVPDDAARLAQLQSGALDLALLDIGLTGEAQAAGLEVRTIPNVGNVFMMMGGMYPGHPNYDRDSPWIQADTPEKGKAIREAMSLAIDRQLILDRIIQGQGQLAAGPLIQSQANPSLTDPSWTLPPYDPELAKQKLAEGGYPDGFPVTVFMYDDYIDLPAIGEAIAGMWEDVGIKVTREPADEGILEEALDKRESDGLAWVKVAGLKGEPATQIVNYRSSAERSNGFYHPAIDSAYDQMIAEQDREKRYAIARQLIESLNQDVAALPLFTVDLPFVVGPKVGAWDPIPGLDEMTGLETVTPR